MKTLLGIVLCVVLGVGAVGAAPALQDNLSFTTFDNGAMMSALGWHTYYARNGGWGHFPEDFTYRVLEVDGKRCVIDSYRPAQNHGQGTAIPIDWDGNPANGMTPLTVQPGMTVTCGITLYIQPYAPGFKVAGTGHSIWSFGPGIYDPDAKPVQEDTPEKPYNWIAGRGPRFQYRLGYDVEGQQIAQPDLRAFAPESADPAVAGKTIPVSTWYDLKLAITFSADGKTANCTLTSRPDAEAEAWDNQGTWSFAVNPDSAGADNPAKWNALLLDTKLGQWSKQPYGEPAPEMIDRIGALSVGVTPAGATGTPQQAQLLQGTRPTVSAKLLGPALAFAGDSPT